MNPPDRESAADVDVGAYCRAVEGHLCRKNDGHLIRIVGPAFETVARRARGESRDAVVASLAELDRELMTAARTAAPESVRRDAARAAAASLASFKDRMPADAYGRALAAALDSEVRAALRLPALAF